MAAVQISAAVWPHDSSGRLGPFQDESGNLWVISAYLTAGNYYPSVFKSIDGGTNWTRYSSSIVLSQTNSFLDSVFDSANGIIYVVDGGGHISSFTLSNTTWAEVYSSGTRPSVYDDVNSNRPIFLTRRSTGEFVVFYQGLLHRYMGSDYRSVYYAICSAAGVWSAEVEFDAGGAANFDCKNAVLGGSNRVHMIYIGLSTNATHRSIDATNTPDTAGTIFPAWGGAENISAYYDAVLSKIVVGITNPNGTNAYIYRASSDANPTWTQDSNTAGAVDRDANGVTAFIYEPNDAKLYAFYRDASSNDLYQNSTSTTTWGTPAVQDVCTAVTAISLGLDYNGGCPVNRTPLGASQFSFGRTTSEELAQSFSFTQAVTLKGVTIWLSKYDGPTDNIHLEIHADNGSGHPDNSPAANLADVGTISPTGLSSLSPTPVYVPCSISLQANTTYWLCIFRLGLFSDTAYFNCGSGLNGPVGQYLAGGVYSNLSNSLATIFYPELASIDIVYNDTNVYFDKLVLAAPPEPIEPVTTNEEFFALL